MNRPDTSFVHAAKPGEPGRVELALRGAAADQRLHGDPAPDDRDLAAVLGRGVVEIVREIERARARPVLRDDDGIAGKILAEMTGEQPAIGVVTVAGRGIADQKLDLLAGERGRLGAGLAMCDGGRYREQQREQSCAHRRCIERRARASQDVHRHSAARSMRMASRCATTSSTCMTSTYL